MPNRDAMTRMHRALLEAALDQRHPSPELVAAVNTLLRENSHAVRLAVKEDFAEVSARLIRENRSALDWLATR